MKFSYISISISISILFVFCFNKKSSINFLFFVASYGVNQLKYLYIKMNSFLSICESGYNIKIIVHHTDIINETYIKHYFCFTQNKFIDISFIKIHKNVKHLLTQQHRFYIHKYKNDINRYDHIGYFEDDMDFTLSNLKYYLYTLKLIEENDIKEAIPGFKRYELSTCTNGDVWKSCPDLETHIEYKVINNHIFIRSTKSHFSYGAMWLLPKSKLLKYIDDNEFLNMPKTKDFYTYSGDREYYASIYWEKHYQSLIPLNRFEDCFIHHLSNKYIHHRFTIQISELYKRMNLCTTQKGLIYTGNYFNKIFTINYQNVTRNKCFPLNYC